MGPETLVPIAGMITGIAAIFGVGYALVRVLQGPVGQALARRISGRTGAVDPELAQEVDALRHQLETLQQRLIDAEERLDFSERLLARRSESNVSR